MTKTLKDFLEVYKPKSPDEQKFVDKHVVIKHKDRNGNGDDVFNGNTKTIKRKEERHGYDAGEDEKVYEALKGDQHKIDANKNGKVDAHDFKLLRGKKKVAEEAEDLDELSSKTLRSYGGKALRAGLGGDDKRMKGANLASAKLYPKQYEKSPLKAKVAANEEVDLEEAVTVNKKNYSWGKMITVHQGSATTYPLHPEHQEKIRKLSDGDKTSFKDETGATVHAHRSGDTVHLKKPGSSNRVTAVAHSHFTEEVDIDTVLDEALDLLMSFDEKTLTPAEMKKREEVVKAIKRGDPKMDKSMAYAIATKTAKRVAEGTMPTADEPTDANKKMAQKVRDMLAKEKKPVKEEAEDLDESAKIAAHLIKRYGDNVRKSHVVSAANDFGVDASKLAKAVRAKLNKTSLAEDEQIDELSVAKLKDYRTKARADAYDADDVDDERRYRKRAAGSNTAGKKIVRQGGSLRAEEVEGLDELSKGKMQDYMNKASDARGHRNLPTKKVDNRYAGVKKASDKLAKEEVETIDELSRKTLGSYVKKAKDQMSRSDQIAGIELGQRHMGARPSSKERKHNVRASKRYFGIDKAVDKLTKEEVETIDELSRKTLGSYVKKASGAEQPKNVMSPKNVPLTKIASYQGDSETGHFGKRFNQHTYDKAERLRKNRETGIKTAVDKLTKEEAEAIDELSKATMGRYINKAATKMGSQGVTAGLKIAADEKSSKNFKDMGKREKGIKLAVNKLTKEDVINRAIEKYVPEELKFTPEERLLKRINGLSEAHINTILGLFEALNKDNQNKMIETAETYEGINQILNFVLENRGN